MKNNFMMVGLNLTNKNILIVGGGKISLRKTKKLLSYNVNITVLALDFLDSFNELKITLIKDAYDKKYLDNIDIVFAATDNAALNDLIINDATKINILSNNSTSQSNMDFKMIASFEFDNITVGVNDNSSVSASKQLKNDIKEYLYENKH
ncbi:precorrin-2 dehydrogenase/sirohydrochlorin ferrochelatase family protein [Mycoplasma sp. P36-A1]|uniref:precorrin-2 dehydrogenase/sirohydrochlorin ferrochelatase family protein n=1 Tax=Mycoplasma sp. P36-A1 TaxID=3252900 RepID=UPI003C2FF2AA